MLRQLKTSATQRTTKSKFNNLAGGFYPLSVCEKQGYDIKMIETNTPEHMKEYHPQIGWTYQLQIHSTGSGSSKDSVEDTTFERAFKRQEAKLDGSGQVHIASEGEDFTSEERL